jgi:hypothetical protein
MNQKELVDLIFKNLDDLRKEVFDVASSLSDDAFEKRFDSKWGAGDILGHLLQEERLITSFFRDYISAKTSNYIEGIVQKRLTAAWFDALNNDGIKFEAPDIMRGKRIGKDEYVSLMEESRSQLRASVYSHINKDFSKVTIPHPNKATLNLIQWLELLEVHERRHLRQLEALGF